MASKSLQNGGDRSSSGFKASLRFFQSQVDNVEVPYNNGSKNAIRKAPLTNGNGNIHVSVEDRQENKPNLKITNSVPSVDNILTNVKNICSTRGVKSVSESNSKLTVVQQSITNKDDKSEHKINPVIYQSSSNRSGRHELGITKSEQVVSVSQKTTVSDHSKRHSLLSSFNPSLEFDADKLIIEGKEIEPGVRSSSSKSVFQSQTCNSFKKSTNSETKIAHSQVEFLCGTVNRDSTLKTVSIPADGMKTKTNGSSVPETKSVTNVKKDGTQVPTNRTFGQCKEKLSHLDSNKTPTGKKALTKNEDQQNSQGSVVANSTFATTKEVVDDNSSEKQTESFESDYDSQDFVVHKATFPDDYLEAMSEDNYSSVNDEYEVEPPPDPDIPSPDYVSDEEEEFLVQHNDVPEYDDVEFIDNSAQYANDPRRYIYYPEDKELEVIPEEDEDDIEDEDMFNDDYKRGK